jgi:hypothetical protein
MIPDAKRGRPGGRPKSKQIFADWPTDGVHHSGLYGRGRPSSICGAGCAILLRCQPMHPRIAGEQRQITLGLLSGIIALMRIRR